MRRVIKFLPLTIIVAAVIAFVYYSVRNFEKSFIENSLMKIEPVFLAVTFIGILSFIFLNRKELINFFRKVPKTTWLLLLGIFVLALILRTAVAPATHRVYFDEDIYLDIGKEILLRGNGSLCNYGDSQCHEYAFMKWPNAYPTILAGSYAIFGISETVAFNLVILLGSLSVILIFLLAYVLTENHKISLYASLIFALIPIHIMWSATTASEPVLVFFTLFAAIFLGLSIKTNAWKMHLLGVLSLAFAIQVRTEGIILLSIFGFMILILDKHRWKKFTEKKFIISWIIFFILITPYLMHVYHSSRTENWGASGPAFAFSYLDKNIPENSQFWFGGGYPNIEHPLLYTILGATGILLAFVLKDNKKKFAYFLVLWFFILFMLYAFFYAGSVKFGTDVRYTLSGYVPLAVLAAIGIYELSMIRKKYEKYISLLIVAIILISFYILYLPTVATPADKIEEAKQARLYHKFVVEEVRKLPQNCYILAHTPSIYLTEGRNSLQTWYGQNSAVMDELFKKTDCIIFDQNVWCNYVPEDALCHYVLNNYNLREINSISMHGHTYTMHYVLGRK